jgi:hypothetical protein
MGAEPARWAAIALPVCVTGRGGRRFEARPWILRSRAALVSALLVPEREAQRIVVEAQAGILQAALERAAVALQKVEGLGPVRGDQRTDPMVVTELEPDFDPAEGCRLELDDQPLDAM